MRVTRADAFTTEAHAELTRAIVRYRGAPMGTVAARDPSSDALNYDQCFTRDFAVSAAVFLMRGETDIVRNFLAAMVEMQSRDRHLDCFRAGGGLMPASFAVRTRDGEEHLVPDFGERAIGRVAPVDSGLWWLVLLQAYRRATEDLDFARRPDVQRAIELILDLSLATRFDMYPTMLVPDGSYMIDRRMGVYGYPLDIQALFYAALSAAHALLPADSPLRETVASRLRHLRAHVRRYYWLDFERLNAIYRYKVEQYGQDVMNAFNIHPESIPDWVLEWLPARGGYLVGNLGPGRMDFRFFAQGNLLAVVSSLADPEQSEAIMDLFEARWDDLVGAMPVKLAFPALEGSAWRTMTGADAKNIPWSYHNGGHWPFLLWLLAAAAVKTGRPELGRRALDVAQDRLRDGRWPEYFDGRRGRLVGKEARCFQTWTIAGALAAHHLLAEPSRAVLFAQDEPEGDPAQSAEGR